MLDGCMYGTERTVFKTEDIFYLCKFDLGTEIQWAYTSTIGNIKQNRKLGGDDWFKGTVVADYETYFILESKSGYRYCIDKVDLATKRVIVKGFEPHVPKALAYEHRL